MAQVRKYQGGGSNAVTKKEEENKDLKKSEVETSKIKETSIQPTKKVGKFTMNGKSLDAQLALERLNKLYAGTSSGERGYYASASKAINEGHEFVYDPSTNTFKVISGDDGSDITSNFQQYIPKNIVRGDFAKNLGATFNSRAHQARIGGEKLSTLNMDVPKKVKATNKTLLERAIGHTDFLYNEDGSFKDTIEQRNWLNNIRNIASYIAADNDGLDDNWDYKNWGASKEDREYLRSLKDELASDPEYFNNLIQRIQDNKLDESDKKLLTRMGFYKNETGASTSSAATQTQTTSENKGPTYDSSWSGGTNWLKGQNISITKNTDGSFQLIGGDHPITNGAYYLGGIDDFNNSIYKNGFAYNGKLYTLDEAKKDAILSQIIQPFIGVQSDNFDDWWKQRNESGVGFINQGAPYFQNYDYNTHYLDGFGKYFEDNNLYNVGIADESRWFNDGTKVLSFVDPRQRNIATGDIARKFLIQDINDPSGYRTFNTIDEVAKALGKTKLETPLNPKSLSLGAWGSYKGGTTAAVKHVIKTGNGKENSILVDRAGKQYLYRGDNGKPIEIKNPAVVDEIVKSGRGIDSAKLEQMLTKWDVVGDNIDDRLKKAGAKYSSTEYDGYGTTIIHYYDIKGNEVGNASKFNGYGTGYTRDSKPTITITKKAQGGTIDWNKLEKLQWGGYFGANNAAQATVIDGPEEADITQAHEVFNPTDGGLTSAEKLQLAGAVTDLLGVGASFVPVYGQIAGAATGAVGSLTRFAGDWKQDGLDWGDIKNLGINLGFDVATLFTGGAGKTAKLIKGVKTLAKPLMIAFAAKGAWDAKDVVGKVAKGEKLTSQDMNTLLQGLSMVVASGHGVKQSVKEIGAAKQIMANKAAAAAEIKSITVKSKGKPKQLKLDADDIKSIAGDEKTFAGVQKAIQKAHSLNAEDAQRVMKNAGITAGKGKLNWNPFNKNTSTPFLNRGAATVVFNSNQPNTLSTVRKSLSLLSPRARMKVLEEGASTITKKDLKLANDYRMGRLSEKQKKSIDDMSFSEKALLSAIGDMAVWNPNVFKKDVLGNSVTIKGAFTWGGKKYERAVKNAKKEVVESITKGSNKKDVQHKEFTYRKDNGSLKIGYRGRVSITGTKENPVFTSNGLGFDGNVRFPWEYKQGGELPMLKGGGNNAVSGKKLINGVNVAQGADFVNMLAQTMAMRNSYKYQENGIDELKKRQFITPQLTTPILNLDPIHRKYAAASDQLRKTIPTSSDMMMNLAGNLAISEKQANLEQQKGAEISSGINSYNAQLNEILNKQRMLDTDTANQRSQYMTWLDFQKKMLKAQQIEDWWANIGNTYSQEIRQRLWNNQEEESNLQFQKAMRAANSQFALDKEEAISRLRSQYKTEFNKDNTIGTFETWIASNPALKQQYEDAINPLTNFKSQQDKYNAAVEQALREKQRRNTGFWYKKGGTIESVNNKIAENADKEARRAVQKMNDNLFKMLQQLIK